MTYNNNVPQAQQTIAFTQPIINANFAKLAIEQKVNHTFTDTSGSNAIASEADGSHQKLSMPNQLADITGALPTGIGAIQYAIGNALFAWDGTQKCAVSAIVGSGSLLLTTTLQDIFIIPNDCIGFVSVQTGIVLDLLCNNFSFFSIGGVATVQQTTAAVGSQQSVFINSNGLTIRLARGSSGVDYTAAYKYIYWPI